MKQLRKCVAGARQNWEQKTCIASSNFAWGLHPKSKWPSMTTKSGHSQTLLFSPLVVSDSVTPWTALCQASLSFTISWSLLKLISIELVMPSNHLILCHPLLLLPSIFPSITVFSSESALCIRWSECCLLWLAECCDWASGGQLPSRYQQSVSKYLTYVETEP